MGTLIFSIYIGWADFFGVNFNIYFFVVGSFLWIFLGSVLNLVIFMGYLLKPTTVICV